MNVKPANAGAITRVLVAAGLPKSERHTTAVKGYATFTEGFSSTQVMERNRHRVRTGSYRDGSPRYGWQTNNSSTGFVTVEYVFGRWDRRTPEERLAHSRTQMERAAEVLRAKGFSVYATEGNSSVSLTVSRKDADGNVVRF